MNNSFTNKDNELKKKNSRKKEKQSISIKKANKISPYLVKGMLSPIYSENDFKKEKKFKSKVGYLGNTIRVTESFLQKYFLIKPINIVDEKDLSKNYKKMFEDMKKNVNEYTIKFLESWEIPEQKYIFLAFGDYPNFCNLEDYILVENLTEERIIILYNQILNCITKLHEKDIYGLDLSLGSFIYDKNENIIQLTDIGLSKILFNKKSIANNIEYETGFFINEYTSPELIDCLKNLEENAKEEDKKRLYQIKSNIYKKVKERDTYDIYQLGVLFYKIATKNKSIFSECFYTKNELVNAIKGNDIDYSKITSKKIKDIIAKMLIKDDFLRPTARELLLYLQSNDANWIKGTDITKLKSMKTNRVSPYELENINSISEQMVKNKIEVDNIKFLSEELLNICESMRKNIKQSTALKLEDKYSELFRTFGLNEEHLNYYQYKFNINESKIETEKLLLILDHIFSLALDLNEELAVEKENNQIWKKKYELLSIKYNTENSQHNEELKFLKEKVDLYEGLIFEDENIKKLNEKVVINCLEKSLNSFSNIITHLKETSQGLENKLEGKVQAIGLTIEDYVKKIVEQKNTINENIIKYFDFEENKMKDQKKEEEQNKIIENKNEISEDQDKIKNLKESLNVKDDDNSNIKNEAKSKENKVCNIKIQAERNEISKLDSEMKELFKYFDKTMTEVEKNIG